MGIGKKKSQEYPQNIDLVGMEWVWRRKRAKNTQGISTWRVWSGYREEKEPRIPKEYRPGGHGEEKEPRIPAEYRTGGHGVGMEKKKSQEYPQNIDLVGMEWV